MFNQFTIVLVIFSVKCYLLLRVLRNTEAGRGWTAIDLNTSWAWYSDNIADYLGPGSAICNIRRIADHTGPAQAFC